MKDNQQDILQQYPCEVHGLTDDSLLIGPTLEDGDSGIFYESYCFRCIADFLKENGIKPLKVKFEGFSPVNNDELADHDEWL